MCSFWPPNPPLMSQNPTLAGNVNILPILNQQEATGLQSLIGQLETLIEVVRNYDLGVE